MIEATAAHRLVEVRARQVCGVHAGLGEVAGGHGCAGQAGGGQGGAGQVGAGQVGVLPGTGWPTVLTGHSIPIRLFFPWAAL